MAIFIAEVSSNHSRDLERCYRFIDESARIGCDAVKFQLFRVDQLFAPEVLATRPEIAARKQWELPEEFVPKLAARCRERGVDFCCTPFYLEAVEILNPHVPYWKIASYELLWSDLLIACAKTSKPVILSTGMAVMDEILQAVATLKQHGCPKVILLHCTSAYPTPAAEANLAAIATLRNASGCEVGWSDHTVEPGVIHRAIHKWGVTVVEFHIDLEGAGAEFEAGHCWLPDQIGAVIRDVKTAFTADGNGIKEPVPHELPDREWRADPEDGLRPLKSKRAELG